MKALWAKHNIYLLTLITLCITVYMILSWDAMPAGQKALGFFCIAITLHEWEEMRFPGGFYDLMTKKFKIENVTEEKEGMSHGVVVVVICFFAYIPFFLWETAPWLAGIPAILGIFEAFIHLVGIKLHNMPHPYTPGLTTALLALLPSSIAIIAFGMNEVSAGGWALAAVCYIILFACMEIGVLHSFQVDFKTLPDRIKAVRKETFGK